MTAELFKDRTAIVTGGARGIGLACAAKIAAGGGRVALWDRDPARRAISGIAEGAIVGRLTSETSVAKRSPLPRSDSAPDILWQAPASPVEHDGGRLPCRRRRQVIDINLTGVFLCNRAVADGMAKRGWGRIVTSPRWPQEGNPNARPTPRQRRASSSVQVARQGTCYDGGGRTAWRRR